MDLLSNYARKEIRTVVGLMSGTSADGVDAAVTKVSGSGETISAELAAFHKTPYPEQLRRDLFALFDPQAPVAALCRMNFTLGRVFAEAALAAIEEAGLEPAQVDLIASHGQTICHLPPERGGNREPATLQIGEPAVIAEVTGLAVVADFRPRDIAAGGEGAPLTPYADYALFRHRTKARAIQNIGGIANVTLLPAGAGLDDVVAFDTGPGNMVIDALVSAATRGERTFDENGEMAARGRVDPALLAWLMAHPFLSRRPPKSTGREEFGEEFVRAVQEEAAARRVAGDDLVATATAFTAESIAASYRDFILPQGAVDEVILGGGGSYNRTLREMLQDRLPRVRILVHEEVGINGDAKEAVAFALLGNETMLGRPASLPRVTGARHACVLGKIVPP